MNFKYLKVTFIAMLFPFSSIVNVANAGLITQWADTVINFSSEYSNTAWSANQVLGAPNTFSYGDIITAWAPSSKNGTLEFITVGYNTAVYASGAVIRETLGNGFVTQIDVLDTLNSLHTVWLGTDISTDNIPFDFVVNWTQTNFLVKGLKIYLTTQNNTGWEEIDAIQLRGISGITTNIPEPSTLTIFVLGMVGLTSRRLNKYF
ncbi:MAG: hypothetical protein COB35_02780 [Gammaproteobacteria bacterium]|nr:MAG: hypothetical protein COB35_02780 [Gammaproteobacteria bacterium]